MSATIEEYKVAYVVDAAQALALNSAVAASFLKVEQAAIKADAAVAKAGQNVAGMTAAEAAATKLGTGLGSLGTQAVAASASVAKIGVGPSGLNRTATNAIKATTALQGLSAQSLITAGGLTGISSSAASVGGSFTTMIAATAGLRVVNEMIAAVGTGLRDAREYAEETAKSNLKLYESLRELANLKNKDAPEKAAPDVLSFMTKTAMNQKESVAFLEQYEGSAPAGRQKGNLAGIDEAKLAQMGAQTAIRFGVDAQTAGDLTGVASQYGKIDSIQQAAGQQEAFFNGLNEGRGKVATLSKSALGISGALVDSEDGGRIKDMASLGVITGVASTVSKGASGAGAVVTQANRLLRKASDTKKFGITDDMDFETALKTIAPHVSGAGGDKKLIDAGFSNSTDRKSVIAMSRQYGVLKDRMAKVDTPEEIMALGASNAAKNAAFLQTKVGRDRMSQNTQALADAVRGTGREELVIAQANAKAEMTHLGLINTPSTNVLNTLSDAINFVEIKGGAITSEQASINQFARDKLVKGMAAQGIDILTEFPNLKSNYVLPSNLTPIGSTLMDQELAKAFEKYGSAFGNSPANVESTLKSIDGTLKVMDGKMNGKGQFALAPKGPMVPPPIGAVVPKKP